MCTSTTTTLHPFNGLFSRTTWVSRHQKGRTILDFNEARDDWIAVASAGPYANHLHFASRQRDNHAGTSPLNFIYTSTTVIKEKAHKRKCKVVYSLLLPGIPGTPLAPVSPLRPGGPKLPDWPVAPTGPDGPTQHVTCNCCTSSSTRTQPILGNFHVSRAWIKVPEACMPLFLEVFRIEWEGNLDTGILVCMPKTSWYSQQFPCNAGLWHTNRQTQGGGMLP